MKHPYNETCKCCRCCRERDRRQAQANANDARMRAACPPGHFWSNVEHRYKRVPKRGRKGQSLKPIYGSAEWAETRGDDLPESPDY